MPLLVQRIDDAMQGTGTILDVDIDIGEGMEEALGVGRNGLDGVSMNMPTMGCCVERLFQGY